MNLSSSPSNPTQGYVSCTWNDGYIFHDPNGVSDNLNINPLQATNDSADSTVCPTNNVLANGGMSYRANAEQITSGQYFTETIVARNVDGTAYKFTQGLYSGALGNNMVAIFSYPDSIEDTNGNIISLPITSNGTFGGDGTIYQDTLGRSLLKITGTPLNSGLGANQTLTNNISVSGLTNPYVVTWQEIGQNASGSSMNFSLTADPVPDYCASFGPLHISPVDRAISSIQLPNGSSYKFSYDGVLWTT